MPGNYAHFRFGSQLLPTLPPEVQRTVRRFRQLYDMGLHGPDLLLYHDPLIKDPTVRLSSKFHHQTGKAFFERVCRAVRMDWSEGAMAYLYGVLAHYALDSVCHPFIHTAVDQGIGSHNQVEAEFDRCLLDLDGKLPPYLYDQTPHMQLTSGECQTVALFYPGTGGAAIGRSVKNMARISRLLTLPKGPKRDTMIKAIRLVSPKGADLIIPIRPDPRCRKLDEDLLALYDEALQQYPHMLEQLRDHLRRRTPLTEAFDPIFG